MVLDLGLFVVPHIVVTPNSPCWHKNNTQSKKSQSWENKVLQLLKENIDCVAVVLHCVS